MGVAHKRQGERSVLRFFGVLTREDVLRARELVGSTPPKQVLLDLTDSSDFDVDARAPLTDFQRALRAAGARTVFLSERPILRGLGTRVLHDASDLLGRAVATADEAERWFASSDQRVSQAFSRLKATNP